MFAIYNIVAAIWALITIVSGIRYFQGFTAGPLSYYARIFDNIYGLNVTTVIPARNQSPPFRDPCIACSSPIDYPVGGNASNQIYPRPFDGNDCTGVESVGGITRTRISHHGVLVPVLNYINQIFTGSTNGDPTQGSFDKSRFKSGTPYYQTINSDISKPPADNLYYYYYIDERKQEQPLLPPCFGRYTTPQQLTYYNAEQSFSLPEGWNAVITTGNGSQQTCYQGLVQTKPANSKSKPTYYYKNTSGEYIGNKYVANQPYAARTNGFGDQLSNVQFVQTSLAGANQLKVKKFSKVGGQPTSELKSLFR